METNLGSNFASSEGMGCFGEYSRVHTLCSKYCVLRIRCAIQQDHNMRMELLDEIFSSEGLPMTIQ